MRKYMAQITLCIEAPYSGAITLSLKTEARQPAAPAKGVVEIKEEDGCISVVIESDSLSGLRALFNSYAYLIHAAWESVHVLRQL
ncbi:MAG: hypothetical protein LRS46_00915 [Desulfurococcales archaeon]|nr:hypothetical protein [Desulfurococcales archaeon]